MPEPDRRAAQRQNGDARTECYQKIRSCFKDEFQKYYAEFPQHFLDERSKQGIERSVAMLNCMFKILDEYDIRR